jgi:hypothetical protein
VFASEGGPNFTTGPAAGTVFPLLQTVLGWGSSGVAADAAANAAGGTAMVETGQLKVAMPGFDGVPQFSGYANLDWTRVGYWSIDTWDFGASRGVFVIGYETPTAAVPITGIATYTGLAQGSVYHPLNQGATEVALSGNASFTADFGVRSVAGSLTNMTANGAPWNSVAFNSLISGNGFSGSTSVTSAPGGVASLAGNATGTIEGRFFGPTAQEAGAVWTLFDGSKAAIGTLGVSRNDPCPDCGAWDY